MKIWIIFLHYSQFEFLVLNIEELEVEAFNVIELST